MEASRTNGNRSGGAAAQRDAGDGLVHFFLATVPLGHEPGDRTTVAGDDQCLSALDIIQQLGEVSLGLGCLDFTHGGTFNWSKLGARGKIVKTLCRCWRALLDSNQ